MSSFRFRLVLYFLLLSLLPLAAVFWGFARVFSESETRLVEARLQAGARAALAAYDERRSAAQAGAARLARDPRFARALTDRDVPALEAILRGRGDVVVAARGGLRVGTLPPSAGRASVAVVGRHGVLGHVVAAIPFDAALVRALKIRSGVDAGDRLALVRRGGVVAADGEIHGELPVVAGLTRALTLSGDRYRALAVPLPGAGGALLALLTPQARIDSASTGIEHRLLAGLLAALLLIASVAFVEGRSIVRTVRGLVHAANEIARGRLGERVPVRGHDELAVLARSFNEMATQLQERLAELEAERERLRNTVGRFADALGATHDHEQLLRVVLETAVEATTAVGGTFAGARGELVEVGQAHFVGDELQVPLARGGETFGVLRLVGPGFDQDEILTASSLGHQAAVALDNLRLHRIVERQALVDGLTGLANRRECEAVLGRELARAARHELPLALVLADLDDFKVVNDVHGHPVGDLVLREFAAVLHGTARDSDLAGRWGGEEFVLVLPATDSVGAVRLAERVRRALAARTIVLPDGGSLQVTASFGVAVFPSAPDRAELIATADEALYEAKRAGKNRVETTPAVRELL